MRIPQCKVIGFTYWPTLLRKIRQDGYGFINQAIETEILFIDDLGAEYKTVFDVSAFNEIFNNRLGKWTSITSNLSLEKLYDEFDARIISRLNREKNEIVQTNAIDFSMRKNFPEGVQVV